MAWWDYRPICEPTASAEAAVVKRSESPLIAAAGALDQGASKALNASVRGRVPVFEHREAIPTPCSGGPLARLLIRPPQPTPNGRIRGCRVRLAAGAGPESHKSRIPQDPVYREPSCDEIAVESKTLAHIHGMQTLDHDPSPRNATTVARDDRLQSTYRPSTTAHMRDTAMRPCACRLPANDAHRSSPLRCGALRARAVRGGALRGARGRGGGGGGHCRRADRVPAGKGTEAVSTCAYKLMGRARARGSAHLRTKRSSGRRHLRGADVQSGQRSPLCSSARRYGQGRPEHRTRTRTRQVRLSAWRGHRTCMRMENPCSLARQGRADVSPEHGCGGPSRPALLTSIPRYLERAMGPLVAPGRPVCGERSTWTCPASRELCRRSFAKGAGQGASAHLASLG